MKKKIKMLLVILSLLCLYSCKSSEEKTKEREEKMLDDYVEMLKNEFNLTLDKWEYYVKEEHILRGNLIKDPESYVLYKYDVPKYKSEFFYDRGLIHVESPPTKFVFRDGSMLIPFLKYEDIEKVPFFNKTGKSNLLFEIIDKYGLRPYLWSQLIYDKSKGNDFEKIEKILDEFGYKIKVNFTDLWICGIINDDRGGGGHLNFVKDKKCDEEYYDEEKHENVRIGIKKYMEKFKEYFSVERNLETIDWEEYMKFNEIYPVLEFEIEGISQEELKKLRKKIKPYFNDKILYIKLMDTNKIVE